MSELSYFPINLKESTDITNKELVIFHREHCSMHRRELAKDEQIPYETHSTTDQFVYLLKGEVTITYSIVENNFVKQNLVKHQIFKIPKGAKHRIVANVDSVLLSIYVE
jgi:quercetin dioxygenase-like cupin family protein